MLSQKLQRFLTQCHAKHLIRTRVIRDDAAEAIIHCQGKRYISFCSNNYLGLAAHPQVIASSQKALTKYGVGSGSAYLISGYTSAHQQLEEALAEFLNFPRVLLFSSGYMANLGVITTLLSSGDAIFADKNNHASLLDGCLLSNATLQRYPNCKAPILKKFLANSNALHKLVITEGLFGMDGMIAPIAEICNLAAQYKTWVMVDDAHGFGVLGKLGKGTLELTNISHPKINILIGTLGKALGSYGAFVASDTLTIECLIQLARTYLYTTAIPPAIAVASLTSLDIMQKEPWRREKLFKLLQRFRHGACQLNIPLLKSETPIQPIIIGGNKQAVQFSQQLRHCGIYVKAILPPTVPQNTARLRITITAEHTEQQIDYLLECLANAIKTNF
jgi:8-amino-7-oxononanoate synthase